MKISGIYQIQSKVHPDRIYIGSAINIHGRWYQHLNTLRRNKHRNSRLQNHFNKYGESDLQFSILLGCEKDDLIKIEQYFLDSHKPFFNINPTAKSNLGRKFTEEHKDKIRKAHKARKHQPCPESVKLLLSNKFKGRVSPMKGKTSSRKGIKTGIVSRTVPQSEETKKKISNGLKEYYERTGYKPDHNKGKPSPLKGRKTGITSFLNHHHTKESKKKISDARRAYLERKKLETIFNN